MTIKRATERSGNVKCHIFILSDGQLNIVNGRLESITYYYNK